MHGPEDDVPNDPALANARETGGAQPGDHGGPDHGGPDHGGPDHGGPDHDTAGDPDGESTTGVDRNQEFVGRVAGDDPAYAGETGAERRAR